MVTAKVPAWSVTGWVRGLIAGAVLLKVKLDCRAKASWFGAPPKADIERGAEGEEGDARRRRNDAHATGSDPTATVATTMSLAVSITETLPGIGGLPSLFAT